MGSESEEFAKKLNEIGSRKHAYADIWRVTAAEEAREF